jgi:hypothetical protein
MTPCQLQSSYSQPKNQQKQLLIMIQSTTVPKSTYYRYLYQPYTRTSAEKLTTSNGEPYHLTSTQLSYVLVSHYLPSTTFTSTHLKLCTGKVLSVCHQFFYP